jgi:uncharacterized protein
LITSTRALALISFVLSFLLDGTADAAVDVPRPEQRDFVVDLAGMLDAGQEAEIRAVASALLDEHATPIVVVTVESLAAHGGAGMSIETFARELFDAWGIGHPRIAGESWDTGVLLVVSREDRVARIELGRGWAHDRDADARRIMNDVIVPRFVSGDHGAGIVAGVRALDAMARSKAVPSGAAPWWWWPAVIATVVLAIASAMSLIRSGRGGIAWLVWGAVFSTLAFVLARRRPRRRACSGGRRLGSFGGGRSGGGGATGRW